MFDDLPDMEESDTDDDDEDIPPPSVLLSDVDESEEEEGVSLCDRFWKCPKRCCKTLFRYTAYSGSAKAVNPPGMVNDEPNKIHNCLENVYCESCTMYVSEDHLCHHKPANLKKISEKYLFCDYECIQGPFLEGLHKVNLAITYDFVGTRLTTHRNIEDFMKWLLNDVDYAGHTVIFHNGKGYDFQFILKSIVEGKIDVGSLVTAKPVMNGSKIMTMSLTKKKSASRDRNSIRFVDSLNFLTMRLKDFPETFGLSTKKGFYCHLFNTKENENYLGAIPSRDMFCYSSMIKKDQEEFDLWYKERKIRMSQEERSKYYVWLKKNKIDIPEEVPVWDNAYELDSYCDADVRVLREGCLAFRQIILDATDGKHDPFSCATIASSAKAIFSSLYLEHDLIGAFTVEVNKKINLAGGRTGPGKLYYKCRVGEKTYYVDITSLYPYINAYGRYPVGHPVVSQPSWLHCNDEILALKNLAIIRCDVECPQDLLHPLLHNMDPVTKRLMFDLRDKKNVTYTSLELQKAIELGYNVTKVYEMLEWFDECVGIFKDYVLKFLKMKQEAAGWPKDSVTDAQKDAFLSEYFEKEGVQLDPSKISKNSGLYATAKFYLNSLWGKYNQRFAEELSQTSILFANVAADELALNKA